MKSIGSRVQVFAGFANQTSGGLKKKNLAKNKYGKIVSKKKQGQKSNLARFLAVGGKPAPKAKPPAPKAKPPAPKAKPKTKPPPKAAPVPTRRSTRVRKKTKRFGF